MKNKGLAHAVILGGLLALVTLFLTSFLWNCFLVPVSVPAQESEKFIIVTTSERESPLVPGLPVFVGPPSVRFIEELPPVVETSPVVAVLPFVETLPPMVAVEPSIALPPPKHLIWLPRVPEMLEPSETIKVPETVKVPPIPTSLTVSSKLYVPEVPLLFDPMVYSEEEFDMFFPVMAESQDMNADFFADFFVVGADSTIAYDDGLYYLGFYVNDDYVGDIEVKFEGDTQSVNALELSLFVGNYITKAASQRLFGDNLPYLSIEEINIRGVETVYDSAAFTVSMGFGLEDMPERSVSITASSINRREQYGMSGAIVLEPAKFSMASSLSLYTLLDYAPSPFVFNNRLISLSVSNRLALFGVGINFTFSVSSTIPSASSAQTSFTLGAWNGFYDFVETSQRLTFGNVGSSLSNKLGSISSTPFGIQFEKSYSYGTDRAKGNQFEYKVVLVEPSEIVLSINSNEIFRRSFPAGSYRLKDFVFTQGANVVKIVIIPAAHPDDTIVEYFDMGYDYRLLGKGDTLYGFGLTVPKSKSGTKSTDDWVLNLPWYNNQYLSYHLGKFTATYWQQIGVTNTFTLTGDLAFSPGVFSGTVNGVFASMIGTSQIQLTLGLDDQHGFGSPSFGGSLNHRFSGKSEVKFGTLNAGINFQKPYPSLTVAPSAPISIGGNLSYNGSLTKEIRFTLTGSVSQNIGKPSPSWNLSFSTGFSPFKGMSLNGTLSLNALEGDPLNPTITAQITGSYSFSQKLNVSASTSQQTSKSFNSANGSSSLGISYRPSSKDSLNLNISGLKFDKLMNHSLVGGWSHSGELASFSIRQQASSSYSRMTTTFTANTSLAFADGAFALGKSVNEAFLLVRPVGELKRATISVARTLDSSPTPLGRQLGSALYNNIFTNTKNTVVVFSTGSSDYSSGASFVYEISPRSRQAFMVKIDIQPSFTISGVLLKADKSPYEQYSSPVYSLSTNEEGQETMTRDDALYLFTDQDGRYILSDVLPGDYLFDLRVEDLWYAVRFTVPEVEAGKSAKDRVLLLEQFWVADPELETRIIVKDAFTQEQVEDDIDVFGTDIVTGYDANVSLQIEDRIDEETFWKIIFPPFEQNAWSFEGLPEPEMLESDFFFADSENQDFPVQQIIMFDSENMQSTKAVTPTALVAVSPAVLRALIPSVPSFSSLRIQSIKEYDEEQQILSLKNVEYDSLSEFASFENDDAVAQEQPLGYSAP
ncbi:MAG TPA: hypothetical protein VJ869_10155 [Sphaerochaeta sp.]|nr:hypothetical protein [Sphaerochaeta sp.]